MKFFTIHIKSIFSILFFTIFLSGCQSVSTGTTTYSPKASETNASTAWRERVASMRERRQEVILEARERRETLSEKRAEAAKERKALAEKRRAEAKERLAERMASNETVKKTKASKNDKKIKRAFAKADSGKTKDKSLRVGWVKIDGKYVYRSARTIKEEQEAAKKAAALSAKKRKSRRGAVPKGNYSKLIAKYAAQHGVPYRLARAVVFVESSFRANATGAAGEIGLMQIRLSTARGMGYKGSARQLYNPATNLYWGMKYLGKAHRLAGGSTCGTILKYNAGHGGKSMNPISRRYCNRVSLII